MYYKTGDSGCLESALKYGHASVYEASTNDSELVGDIAALQSYDTIHQKINNSQHLKTPHSQAAVSIIPVVQPINPTFLHGLALSYHEKFKITGNIQDLEASLKYDCSAVLFTPLGDQTLSYYLQHLATNYATKFENRNQKQDLEVAQKFATGAVAALQRGHPDHTQCQLKLGNLYHRQIYGRPRSGTQKGLPEWYFVKYGEPGWLDYNKQLFGRLDEEEEEDDDGYEDMAVSELYIHNTPKYFDGLVSSYWHIHEKAEGIQDLEVALRPGHLAVDRLPIVYPDESIQDQDTALEFNQAFVDAAPADHSELPKHQKNLAVSYIRRYTRLGNASDLSTALQHGHAAIDAMNMDHPLFVQTHLDLARIYKVKYTATGDAEALETAISFSQTNLTLTSNLDSSSCRSELASCYQLKYQSVGNAQDLMCSFTNLYSGINTTPLGHPALSYYLQGLALSHLFHHSKTGEIHSLHDALKYGHATIDATYMGDYRIPHYQQKLSACYLAKYKATGDMENLEIALNYGILAKEETPEKHPELPKFHEQLIDCYETKYRRTGDIKDLYAAATCAKIALKETPPGHPNMPRYLYIIGILYHSNFQRDRNFDTWEVAINCCHTAVLKTPTGHPNLPEYQYGLALVHADMYRHIARPKDLKSALSFFQLATEGLSIGHSNLPRYQQGLGRTYQARYRKHEGLQDLRTAQKLFWAAIQGTPKGHYTLPSLQHDLALCYKYKYKQTKDPQNLTIALELYNSALQSITASPQLLWDIGIQYIKIATELRTPKILDICSSVLNILPSLLWLGSSINVRHETLIRQEVPAFISIAVNIALKSSQPQVAIEFFEQGLSTTHRQIQQLNRKYDSLENQLPDEAKKLRELSILLKQSSDEPHSLNYHVLAQDRKNLIDKIHTHPNFSDFLLPLKYPKLSMAAKHGPVILLNVNDTATDVIIMLSPTLPPLHFPLPEISSQVVQAYIKSLKGALRKLTEGGMSFPQATFNSPEHVLNDIKKWLWNMVVKPIFSVLQENGFSRGRLWWCPSGPFTNLPLHAAAPPTSKYIQSYTPTLDALVHSNSRLTQPDANDIFTAIGVIASEVPGWEHPLKSVEGELNIVGKLFQHQGQQLKDEQVSLSNVIQALHSSAWLHFSCHGEQDSNNPLESGLILHNTKLELGHILGIDLPKAKFAFLSACETAKGDGNLPNEAMHLAGGFIAAGFQGTIGTWWVMTDQDGPLVAELVYEKILGKDNIPDVRRAAEGLHLAVQTLRKNRARPSQWMPFIHMGI
ncbi:CHAT domain-containing protein [Collybia nuda]|uniref:CHAT domain-containing protein n=1 Tax=Collybia nuda TaxID=64659 RepID=A0A9P5XTF4_9AGAR|nr:CHAT domain-containing protein [Collybia nuda]